MADIRAPIILNNLSVLSNYIILQLSSCKDFTGIVCIYNFHKKQVSGLNSACPAMRKEILQKSNWPCATISHCQSIGMNFVCAAFTYCSKTDELGVSNQVGWRSNDLYMRLSGQYFLGHSSHQIHTQQKPGCMVYSTADIVHQFLKVVHATRLCGHHQSRKKKYRNQETAIVGLCAAILL